MSSKVNLLSVGTGSISKVSVKSSVKTGSQDSDFSKTLDQAQQARNKDTAKTDRDYNLVAKDESTKAEKPEATQPEAADSKEKADAANADTKPETAEGEANVPSKGEADSQQPAEGDSVIATDDASAAMAAAMAEGVIATQGQQPLAELNTYFKSINYAQDVTNKELAEQQADAKPGYIQQQPGSEQQKQPLDSLQAAGAMEEMAPVDSDTPSVAQSNQAQNVKQQPVSSVVPNSIEALLGSRQKSQQAADTNAAQGRTDNGQQLLNMLPGQRTFTTVQANSAEPKSESTVGINQLSDLVGQVELVQGEGNSRGFAQQQNQNRQGGMTNSQGQQQGIQLPGEADFDMVVPGDEITQENSLGQSKQDNAAGFQQILGNAQNTDNAGAINEPQQAQQTNRTYNVPQQIVEQAKLLQNGQNSEMIIKLNPEHLGELSLKVSVNGNGGVTATFHTDNAQVRAILETSMIQLKQQLNEQGIKVDSVEVQTGLPDGQLPDGQAQQGFSQQSQGQQVRSQQIDLRDFEETSDALAAEPVNNATTDIHDSEGNVISSGVDYSV